MAAPAPRTADGHPDFTGMYGWVTRANCGAKCNDTQIPNEFINIASSLKGRVLPLKPEALAIQKKQRLAIARAADRDIGLDAVRAAFLQVDRRIEA